MHENESRIGLSEAAKIAPGRPHLSSVWRWCRKGCIARNGARVRLDHERVGNRVFTSREALQRFAQALTEADEEYFAPDDEQPTSAERRREQQAALAAVDSI